MDNNSSSRTSTSEIRRERQLIESARKQIRDSIEDANTVFSTAKDFAKLVLKSKLVDRNTLEACAKKFAKDPQYPNHTSQKFAKFLIQCGMITVYQAERLLAGRTEGFFLGGCKILDQIGAGGMGKVYLAEQVKLERKVAVKTLLSDRSDNPNARARFLREAQAVAKLKHPNIVQIYDIGQKGKSLYIIMELVKGMNLSELLKKNGPMSVEEATGIVKQVATGLQHAFENGIVHRDIKPSNLVLEEQTVKILDLGLARISDSDDSLTQEGSGLGTPDYMSPEQFVDAHNADIRSDLYSLGCTWYHLLTGRPPFQGGTAVQKGLSHINNPPTPIQSVTPSVPDNIASMIDKLMAKKPEHRYQTPNELLNDLKDWDSEIVAATMTWDNQSEIEQLHAEADSKSSLQTPAPAEISDSETFITAPSSSIPSFIFYLIPVVGALVLGGAYFGIKAIPKEKPPLIIDLTNASTRKIEKKIEPETGTEDQTADRAKTQTDAQHVVEPDNNQPEAEKDPLPPKETVSKQADSAEKSSSTPSVTPIRKPPAAPPMPKREPKIWQVEVSDDLLTALKESLSGDRIEMNSTRPIEIGPIEIQSKDLTFFSSNARIRPMIVWKVPEKLSSTQGLLSINKGRLSVEGVDFYVDVTGRNVSDSEINLFRVEQSDLSLIHCSITVIRGRVENRAPVTAISLKGERPWDPNASGDAPEPLRVEIRDSMIRGVHTLAFVDSRQTSIVVENSIVCGPGELFHVFHTRPLEYAHHELKIEIGASTLDVGGPLFSVECRPFDLNPVRLHATIRSSFLGSSRMGIEKPPQIFWKSPVQDSVVSTALHWTGEGNCYFQRSDGLQTKTSEGPVVTRIQTPDDWNRLQLGTANGWFSLKRLPKQKRKSWQQRLPDDYRLPKQLKKFGVETKRIARPRPLTRR